MSNKLLLLCCSLVIALGSSSAQNFERVLRHNFWNEGTNVAGLRSDSLSISNAELGGLYEAGEFRDTYMAKSLYDIGLKAKTITHLKSFSMIGSFGFTNTEAYDMCGSMFVRPGFYPIDVVEFDPGRKTFQDYTLSGGISVDIADGWRLGGLLDFKAYNASKRKDLRYSSYNLDMTFAPGVQYYSSVFSLGLSAIYRRSTETIKAEQIGQRHADPFVFFDEGLVTGNYQVWTGSGTRLNEAGVTGLPVERNAYGLGLQASTGSAYLELNASAIKGRVGERQIIWYRYSGFEANALLGYRFGANALRANFNWERLNNRETVFDKISEGGITRVHEYGSMQVLSGNSMSAGLDYEWLSDVLELRVSPQVSRYQSIVSPLYPFVYTRDLTTAALGLEGLGRIDAVEIGLNLGAYAGFIKDDARTIEQTQMEEPYRHEELNNLSVEYLCLPRLNSSLSCKYIFSNGLYLKVQGKFVKAFNNRYIVGDLRYGAGLSIGYNFK